ncbi:hypothetical protein V0U79_00990 [Hyphobacterium sp. HN65]|uniref:Uncharacterized protein n=1 Tax=Hyphobacterium lacteum TaxID=3116575 RepID=A0ABU7LMT3_9PROT|nr:hypothetical protein [Hyphobacterium sp. HN65]MEE2524926.1 hypothetical protein [Hyphobacterium sp. HN65]
MWDKVFRSAGLSDPGALLRPGVNWRLEETRIDGSIIELVLSEYNGTEVRKIRFSPLYFSLADEFSEAYSGLQQEHQARMEAGDDDWSVGRVGNQIGANFPGLASDYFDLRAYQLSAMEWHLRFVSKGKPQVAVSAR